MPKKGKLNELNTVEKETPKKFSSIYVNDYYEEIERLLIEQENKRGKPSQSWKNDINKLMASCESLRRKYAPKSDKLIIYKLIQ